MEILFHFLNYANNFLLSFAVFFEKKIERNKTIRLTYNYSQMCMIFQKKTREIVWVYNYTFFL